MDGIRGQIWRPTGLESFPWIFPRSAPLSRLLLGYPLPRLPGWIDGAPLGLTAPIRFHAFLGSFVSRETQHDTRSCGWTPVAYTEAGEFGGFPHFFETWGPRRTRPYVRRWDRNAACSACLRMTLPVPTMIVCSLRSLQMPRAARISLAITANMNATAIAVAPSAAAAPIPDGFRVIRLAK